MKKNTLAKWVLASAAMVVAFGCQSKTPPETSTSGQNDSSCCPCDSNCSTFVAPVAKDDKTALNETKNNQAEAVSTYTIEIEEAENVFSVHADAKAPAAEEVADGTSDVSVLAAEKAPAAKEAPTADADMPLAAQPGGAKANPNAAPRTPPAPPAPKPAPAPRPAPAAPRTK